MGTRIVLGLGAQGVARVANLQDTQYATAIGGGGQLKADAVQASGGTLVAGSNQLSISGNFSTADVGKFVMVPGAGPLVVGNGGPFTAYIGSVSSGVASLVTTFGGSTAANATTTVSGATVTYGSAGLTAALTKAIADGLEAYLPEGSYVWDAPLTTTAALRLRGTGDGTIVYFPTGITLATVSGPGLQGVAATLATDAHFGDQSISVSSVPAGLSPGDYIWLSSSDPFATYPNSSDTTTTCGEFMRVYGISGTTVYFNAPIASPVGYRVAASAQIQKVTFLRGCRMTDIRWICGTPEAWTAPTSHVTATQTVSAGGGNGFVFKFCANHYIARHFVKGHAGTFFHNASCIRYRYRDIDFIDGADSPDSTGGGGQSYGYGISNAGSAWGTCDGGSVDSGHGFVNFAPAALSGLVGQTKLCEVRNVVSRNGYIEPFIWHDNSMFCDAIDCRAVGGPAYPPEFSHQPVFNVAGYYNRVIGPICENVSGSAIGLIGQYGEAIRPVIRQVRPWLNYLSRGIYLANGGYHKVISPDIDGVPVALSGTQGYGIQIAAGATHCEISGKGTIRNTDLHAIQIDDTSATERIDGITGYDIGVSGQGGSIYVINRAAGGTTPNANWQNIAGINIKSGLVSNASGLIASLIPATYKFTATNSAWAIPSGYTKARVVTVGGGGGGGGGGSQNAAASQVGGAGGTGSVPTERVFDLGTDTSLNITVGAGGTPGVGGAAGGNVGTAATNGSSSSVVGNNGNVNLIARGGGRGLGGAVGTTTTVAVGPGIAGGSALGGLIAGGGTATSTAGNGGGDAIGAGGVGGAGGCPASATVGGLGGAAGSRSVLPANVNAVGNNTGSTAGSNGANATDPGCGGGGGGGGAWNGGVGSGAGGNGGSGAAGIVYVEMIP